MDLKQGGGYAEIARPLKLNNLTMNKRGAWEMERKQLLFCVIQAASDIN